MCRECHECCYVTNYVSVIRSIIVAGYCEHWKPLILSPLCVGGCICACVGVCACMCLLCGCVNVRRMQWPLPRHPPPSPGTFSDRSSLQSPRSARMVNKTHLSLLHQTPQTLHSVTSLVTRSGTSREAACRAWDRSLGLFFLQDAPTQSTSPPPSLH